MPATLESARHFGRHVALVGHPDVLAGNCAHAAVVAIENQRLYRGAKCGHVAKSAAPGDAVARRAAVLPNRSFDSDDVTAIELQRLGDVELAIAPVKFHFRGSRERVVRVLGALPSEKP